MGLLTFAPTILSKSVVKARCKKSAKSTYRLFALNNLVDFQTFFGEKNSTSVLIKFLHLITNETQLDHFACYAN